MEEEKKKAKKSFLREAAVTVVIVIGLLEAALHIYPRMIPFALLGYFQRDARAEVAQRIGVANKYTTREIQEPDGKVIKVYRPNATLVTFVKGKGAVNEMKMDDNGFCNRPTDAYQKEQFDVIVLGDSFTWCTNVNPEDTYASRLEKLSGKSVYNLAVQGIGIHEYVRILKLFGIQKKPKVVVMGVYEGNDLRDAVRYDDFYKRENSVGKVIGGELQWPCTLPDVLCIPYQWVKEGPVGRTSYSFNLFFAAAKFGKDLATGKVVKTSEPGWAQYDFHYTVKGKDGSSVAFNPVNNDRDEPYHADRLAKGEISLDLFIPPLEEFVALAKENGFVPAVLYLPSTHTVYGDFVEFTDPGMAERLSRFSEAQRAFFKEKGKELGYQFLDATASLHGAVPAHRTENNLLHYQETLHPTAEGHRVTAEFLAQFIRR